MKITKTSFSGKENTMDIPISEEEYEKGMEKFNNGVHIQHAFPTLSPEHREFLLTGTTPEEWAEVFPPEDDEEEDTTGYPCSNPNH